MSQNLAFDTKAFSKNARFELLGSVNVFLESSKDAPVSSQDGMAERPQGPWDHPSSAGMQGG